MMGTVNVVTRISWTDIALPKIEAVTRSVLEKRGHDIGGRGRIGIGYIKIVTDYVPLARSRAAGVAVSNLLKDVVLDKIVPPAHDLHSITDGGS
jgi:hypothetical protein